MDSMERTFDRHVGEAWIERVQDDDREQRRDELAVEEPLEIRVAGEPLAVTMRTPGEDEELAAGFLAGEGLIGGAADIVAAGPTEDFAANVVDVQTRAGLRRDAAGERRFYLSSSCGVCGKGALEHVAQSAPPSPAGPPIEPEVVLRAPAVAREAQTAFERTGGLHATALFDADGEMLVLREDVGRHNAIDKVVGSQVLARAMPLNDRVLMVSGRVSFEIVQKAAVAGVPIVCAVSAPSDLAVEAADRLGVTLVGFLRGDGFNVYAHDERIDLRDLLAFD